MSDEQNNAMEIARLQGDRQAIRAEMQAMESRIEASLARMERKIAERDRDNTRWQIGLWIAAIVILGILIRWPG